MSCLLYYQYPIKKGFIRTPYAKYGFFYTPYAKYLFGYNIYFLCCRMYFICIIILYFLCCRMYYMFINPLSPLYE